MTTSEDKDGVRDQTILKHLKPIRDARVWTPSQPKNGVSLLNIRRIIARGDVGAIVEFLGNN